MSRPRAERPCRQVARRIISWYAGVPAHQVAEAERIAEVTVREIRKAAGRGAELGGTRTETLLDSAPVGAIPGQLSLAGYDGMMRANRGVRL